MVREALTMDALGALAPGEAAAYFVARRAEGLTPSEDRLLVDWLARDQTNQRALDSAERAWQSFDGAQSDEVLNAMRAHALAPKKRNAPRWSYVAATAALLAAACAALAVFVPGVNPWTPSAGMEYASARGEVREIQLADGSTMTLDADSVAVVRLSDDERAIKLEQGRAFFAVAHDETRPFVVTAAGESVVALGTRFDVNLAVGDMTVTLLEGRVQVGSQTLSPGQQYIKREGEAIVRTIGAASENVVAWRVGLIDFDDQPLSVAAAVMNRYSVDQIVISDPALGALRISGQFRAGETQRFAETLAEMHHLRAVREANQIELVR